ncbi:MAG: DUF1697 domain-containing protein [Spirochaetales bacterium]|nr:DUF1697 domain-containing protein [Spirochaetales bacterium]
MNFYISMLRGINVGGRKKVAMEDLRKLYAGLGLDDVQTYINSGNVFFTSNIQDVAILSDKIKNAINGKYGFDVPVIIRTTNEVQAVIGRNPFLKETKINIEKLHVTFLSNNPHDGSLEAIRKYKYDPDRFVAAGREVFLYCPDGYGKSKYTNSFFEKHLEVTATTRNWKTVNVMAGMMKNFQGNKGL